MPAFSIMKLFSGPNPRIAVVVDEHGTTQGVITPTDIFEEIAGEVAGQLTTTAKPILQEDGSWLVDGLSPMHEVLELLEFQELPEEERHQYQTLGGLVMRQLGKVPITGDSFDWLGFRFEVVEMDARRVDKVAIRQHTDASEGND
jgi:putative hemolysin